MASSAVQWCWVIFWSFNLYRQKCLHERHNVQAWKAIWQPTQMVETRKWWCSFIFPIQWDCFLIFLQPENILPIFSLLFHAFLCSTRTADVLPLFPRYQMIGLASSLHRRRWCIWKETGGLLWKHPSIFADKITPDTGNWLWRQLEIALKVLDCRSDYWPLSRKMLI